MAARVPRLARDLRARRAWLPLVVFGRVLPARRLVAAVAARRPASLPLPAIPAVGAPLAAPSVTRAVDLLRRDGLCAGLRLDPGFVAEIRRFAESRPCEGGLDWSTRFWPHEQAEVERRSGQSLVVGHFPDNERDCPAIGRFIRHPWLHAVAAGYFGRPATILDVRLWWSFPSTNRSRAALMLAGQDSFHFDLTDWQELKFFFYLTDVGPRSGAHHFVRGSHARRPLRHQLSPFSARTAPDILAAYGPEAIEVLTGPAGFGFVEDPFGFHTGAAVEEGRRLCLEVSFGITGLLRRRDYGGPG
ncbi:hypothetical protein CKO45_26060 [Paracraurococcus ruber]|uniref:Phytanoyl-CoA dioxygenase (PhyH) n=2 Tax=Paracraurococcus ruber TaxID=77675 RepID=A0ABS1D4E6_9PROT|nr:hypothetical protein [Paracraurococcus ruber]